MIAPLEATEPPAAPTGTDPVVVRMVVVFIGLYALGTLGSITWLVSVGATEASLALVAGLAGTAIGSLGTLLASTRVAGK